VIGVYLLYEQQYSQFPLILSKGFVIVEVLYSVLGHYLSQSHFQYYLLEILHNNENFLS